MPKSCWCRKLEFDVHARACVRTNPYCVQYWYRRGILSSTRERVCMKHVPFGEYALGLQYTSVCNPCVIRRTSFIFFFKKHINGIDKNRGFMAP
jgi:hypothetical protein